MSEAAAGGAPSQEFTLLGDQPHCGVGDPLGFERVVGELAALILGSRSSTPFTLGIEGSWGMGKSTLMGALQTRLEADADVTPVRFNAWTAEEGRVLEAFVKTVLGVIGAGVVRRALYKERAIGLLRLPASFIAGKLGISSVVDTAWERFAEGSRGRNDLRQLVDKAVGDWRRKRSRPDDSRLLCVFVDDLDRCSPKVVLEVLEAMKLYLDVPGIVFVVGYDEDIVSDVVLRDKGYGDKTKARDYLEKFIQITYRIPRAEEDQSYDLLDSLLGASGAGELLGGSERQLVIEGSDSNPRRIKRFINGFVLLHGLDPRLREFHPQSLVRVLLLRMYFPEFARLLENTSERDPVDEFLEYEAARGVLRRGAIAGPPADQARKAFASHELLDDHELPGDKSPAQLLGQLEEYVPVEFPALAERGDFVSLIRNLGSGEDWGELRLELSRGALAGLDDSHFDTAHWPASDSPGLQILWVDDEVDRNEALIKGMEARGAKVSTALDAVEMEAMLDVNLFDVLISDIARGNDQEAGLDALKLLRDQRPLETPGAVVFYTARATPARMERAKELDALLVTDPQVLLDVVASLPRAKR